MRSKRIVKPTKIFDNSITNSSRNKNKQKNASKKSDMFSNVIDDMTDLGGGVESRNCNEMVTNGDNTMEVDGLEGFTQENQPEKEQEDDGEMDWDSICITKCG
ncbi:hypothetical protein Tco_0662142 [Tanacetum coccineum]